MDGSPKDEELAAVAGELDRAENEDDDERLAALDSIHARLSSELDKPADDRRER